MADCVIIAIQCKPHELTTSEIVRREIHIYEIEDCETDPEERITELETDTDPGYNDLLDLHEPNRLEFKVERI